ncbi:putative transposase OrfB [Anaerohalosphaera lusitana]|uniref:Putative transposase OrfB n=1 Tax=Anaerohalosphaera lusitana TaxID=1936003 RepID=A0A1U9NQ18_9BACT|nr:integrase core domain-containing protein [Anaerohalosphaera lusitana]AQT69824.1 putative transposase OrfB [Anaerohalosphaera lusitana]
MKEKLWLGVVACLAYCIDKELYHAIDYLKEQVRVLVEQQEKQNKRILLTNRQRMRIAAKAKRLSRKMLDQTTVLFSPDTVMGWYRNLIADKYDGSKHRGKVGRPQVDDEIIALVLELKKQNRRWGYQKITDQIVYLGYRISKSCVRNILVENGFDPEPDLTVRSTWHEFIQSHWEVLAACDFFTVELLVKNRLVRCTVFFVIEIASRKVFFAPVKPQPDGDFMKQMARTLTNCEDGFLKGKTYLIHDRDPLYRTDGFHALLKSSGIEPIRLPAHSPDLNVYAERFVRSVKSECLDYLILSSVEQLEYVLDEYSNYYHHERIHQSLGRIIEPKHQLDETADIRCIERLGGLLKSYHRLAA